MKKILLYSLLLTLFCGVVSCDKESEDISTLTSYVTIVLEGGDVVYHPKGTPWVDPGYTADENGADVTSSVTATTPDVDKIGSYTVTYSATNTDGFTGSVSRKVVVYTPGLSDIDISGVFSGDVFRINTSDNSTRSFSDNEVVITKTSVPGLYQISDWIAGFYNVGYGYGAGYAFTGYFEMVSETEFRHIESSNPWGDPADDVVNWTYDAATGGLSYHFMWLGKYDFAITLTKVE
ncbi:MAG: BT_2262 family domain-containing protein [Marinifilaceae bacterium]